MPQKRAAQDTCFGVLDSSTYDQIHSHDTEKAIIQVGRSVRRSVGNSEHGEEAHTVAATHIALAVSICLVYLPVCLTFVYNSLRLSVSLLSRSFSLCHSPFPALVPSSPILIHFFRLFSVALPVVS